MTRVCPTAGGWCDSGGGHAIAYRRVSTREQSESGLGMDAQRSAILTAAARLGLTVAAWCDDAGVSGGLALEERPALLAAIQALTRGSTLMIAKRDRLGRDYLHVGLIQRLVERKGARIYSCAGEGNDEHDPTARLMRIIVDAFADYERALIRSRTKAALQAKKQRGEVVGSVPLGRRLGADGQLETHPDEQRALELLRELRATGLTLRATAEELNRRGFRTRKGGRWHHQYVWNEETRGAVPSPVLGWPGAR